MQFTIATLAVLASGTVAQFCGVVTSPVQSYVPCTLEQYPVMDAECTAIGGTVSGHNQESGDARSNCITYCNNVPTGGHDTTGDILGRHSYHVYVVDSCTSCGYCGAL
ncbi:hypothetical protein BDP55DRAFT_633308 [Colletotrichum godetiae]|uniref:Uncharacterized protein n=1 Tax=Colletotrichum godetiae TaxID=1209918 RepID=A0AAJ0AKI0_9PEZI|nr:uncharacterized protein BDP55DRAFT_633308 [Colletotrichum godetiae]KAK1674098.1 hypothetical protein BDP55DRAFT_633308 [Colletotrichum godetiae]